MMRSKRGFCGLGMVGMIDITATLKMPVASSYCSQS